MTKNEIIVNNLREGFKEFLAKGHRGSPIIPTFGVAQFYVDITLMNSQPQETINAVAQTLFDEVTK